MHHFKVIIETLMVELPEALDTADLTQEVQQSKVLRPRRSPAKSYQGLQAPLSWHYHTEEGLGFSNLGV